MEFSRPEYWNGLLFPSPGVLPNPGIEPRSPALQTDSFLDGPYDPAIQLLTMYTREICTEVNIRIFFFTHNIFFFFATEGAK